MEGGRSRYKVIVSLKFTTHTIQRYSNFRVDVGATSLQRSVLTVHNASNAKIQKQKGGRSRYKHTDCLKFTTPTIQKIQKFKGGRSRYKLECPESSQHLQYKDTEIEGSTFEDRLRVSLRFTTTTIGWTALQTCSVVSLQFTMPTVKHTET